MATPATNPSSEITFKGEKIETSEIKPGDHMFAYRYIFYDTPFTRYQHHGIYVGKNSNGEHMVVDFNADSKIKRKTIEEFLGSSPLYRVQYGGSVRDSMTLAAGSTQMLQCLLADEVLKNVEYYEKNPGEWGQYSRLTNNCEQFCVFCKTGKRVDAFRNQGQILRAIIQALFAMGVTVYTLKQWAVTAPYADDFVSIIGDILEEYQKLQKEDKDKEDESKEEKDKKDESKDEQDKKDESKEEKDKKDEDEDKEDQAVRGVDETLMHFLSLAIQKMVEK